VTITLPPFLELLGVFFGAVAAAFLVWMLWVILFCISDEAGQWAWVLLPVITVVAFGLSLWGLWQLTSG